MTPNDLETLRRDGLREVASIGAGHAATALSQLTNRRIMISVPQVRRVAYADLPQMLSTYGDHVAVVSMRISGVLNAGGKPVQSGSAYIDDRAKINRVSIQAGEITVDALLHGPADPMCCPAFPVVQTLRLLKNRLVLTRQTSRCALSSSRLSS